MTKDNTKGPGGLGKGGSPRKRSDAFERKTFRTSRLADFASIPELIKQTGQPPEHWPLVIQELADNGFDDAEEGGTAPEIESAVTDNSIKARSKTGWPPSAKFPANAGENAAGESEQRSERRFNNDDDDEQDDDEKWPSTTKPLRAKPSPSRDSRNSCRRANW